MIIFIETTDAGRLIEAESRAQARAYVVDSYILQVRAATAADVAKFGSDKIERIPRETAPQS